MSEQNGNGGLLSREKLLEARRRQVPTSLGSNVLVRGLGYSDLSALMGVLLDVSALGDEAQKPEELVKTTKGLQVMAGVEKVLIAACLEPQLFADPKLGPVPADLPLQDQMAIFTAVLELSGYSKDAGKAVRP